MSARTLSDGDAMLLAYIRRKGCAEALADWCWERLPPVPPPDESRSPRVVAEVVSGSMHASIVWFVRNASGVWVRLYFVYGQNKRDRGMLAYVPTDDLGDGGFGAGLLARHIKQVYVRRKK